MKVADAASFTGALSDKAGETVDAFKPDMWKHFGSSVSRNKKEKG